MVYALCAPRTLCIRFILCVRLKHSTKLFNISSMITDNNLNYSSWAIVSPRSFLVLSCTIFSFLNNTSLKIKRISEQWCVLFTQPLQLDQRENNFMCRMHLCYQLLAQPTDVARTCCMCLHIAHKHFFYSNLYKLKLFWLW